MRRTKIGNEALIHITANIIFQFHRLLPGKG